MNATLLEKLVCPRTLRPLQLTIGKTAGQDVDEGRLDAPGAQYPISDGVAQLLAEPVRTQTAESFAQKWRAAADYRKQTDTFYQKWYLQRYGFASVDALATVLQEMSFVLDAGTGSGRDAAWFASLAPAAAVYGVDLTLESLRNARRTVAQANVALVQADINRLPFPDGFFDFISCDQVIHHTSDPPAAFARLAAKLRPGGQICVYVYRKKADIREFVDDHVRGQIRHLPFDRAMAACAAITRLGRALANLRVEIDIEQDIPVLGIRAGKYDLQRFVHFNLFKCFWNDDFDFFTNNLINADWYHPEFCFRYDPAEFRAWFDGWDILHFDEQEAGLSCRARKR